MEQRLIEILKIALEYQVSDIHFDITNGKKEKMNIEMRIDGKMKQLIPKEDDIRLFYYLMYRANLDVSNTFQPQTGSFHERVLQQDLSLRFSIVSSYYMRSGVLRILNSKNQLCIQDLCFDPSTTMYLTNVMNQKNGLYLFSGPTGSGKTTTLYTLLNAVQNKKT